MDRFLLALRKRRTPRDPQQATQVVATRTIAPLPDLPQADTNPSPSESPPIPSFPDGVKVLHDCPEATIDICFVHGLTGDRESTWTADGQSAPWPKTLLPPKLSRKARILTYGYDAYIVRKGVAGSNRLIDHATNLLHDLATDRSISNASARPLIFVTHSLGGLVCKKAVLLSRNNPEADLAGIFDCVKGIVFLGTPHKGSWMADWAKIPASAIGVVKSTNKSLLGILETNDQLLESIQIDFWSMVRGLREGGRRFEVACFFEELPLFGVGKVVSKESATLEGYSAFSIHANHNDMVRFASAEENGFKRLLGVFARWTSQVRLPQNQGETEGLPRTSPPLATEEHDRGGSFVNPFGSSTQYITTGSGPTNIGQHQIIHQTFVQPPPPTVPKPLEDCLRSLAFPQMESRSHDIDTAVAGTCDWLLRHEAFNAWAACDRGLLWIKGKPGSGKSTMLKYALDNHKARDNGHDLVVDFFFHGRGDELQRTPLGLFRSLLHQILAWAPDAAPDLVATFETKCRNFGGPPGDKWHWHEAELRGFLKSTLFRVLENRSVWLFVDALDECGEDNAVTLVKVFKSLLQSLESRLARLGQFRICFSCRHYPILGLDGAHGSVFEICAEDENASDISTFVDGQLAEFCARTPSTLPGLITQRASGVFMWARLVVEKILDLDREGFGLGKMEATVASTPPGLDDLYRQLIQTMEPASLKLVEWICFAERPLSIDELRWAMVIEADSPYKHKTLQAYQNANEYVPDGVRMKRRVQTLSRGLAEVTPTTPVVQFIHQSVKDFFVEEGLSALGGYETFTEAAIRAHFRFSKICIRYLSMDEIGQSTRYEEDKFPFLSYATTSWLEHTQQCDAESVSQKDLLALLGWPSNAFVRLWVRVYRTLPFDFQWAAYLISDRTNLVHLVSRYGVARLLSAMLENVDEVTACIDAEDRRRWTPLSWAAQEGHTAVVKLLLNTGKVEVNTDYSRTPFLCGAENGHTAVVKVLLSTGKVDVSRRDTYGRTALSHAAQHGHVAVVELLLDTGKVHANERAYRHGRTPLSHAAQNGHKAVVELLLGTGEVDVDMCDTNHGRTALSHAAENGHAAIVKLLLGTSKVDVDVKDQHSQTPLSYAAENGHEAVVELLLSTDKVDVNRGDITYGRTPLSYAAENGHAAVVKLLLGTGKVDVDVKDQHSRTPLSHAAKNGHDAVVKLLLGTGKVHVDAKDNYGRTALLYAAGQGHTTVVKLLLGTGKVDVEVKDQHSWPGTLLGNAAWAGQAAIVKLLLDTGKVDVDLKDELGGTALSYATEEGHTAVVKLLRSAN